MGKKQQAQSIEEITVRIENAAKIMAAREAELTMQRQAAEIEVAVATKEAEDSPTEEAKEKAAEAERKAKAVEKEIKAFQKEKERFVPLQAAFNKVKEIEKMKKAALDIAKEAEGVAVRLQPLQERIKELKEKNIDSTAQEAQEKALWETLRSLHEELQERIQAYGKAQEAAQKDVKKALKAWEKKEGSKEGLIQELIANKPTAKAGATPVGRNLVRQVLGSFPATEKSIEKIEAAIKEKTKKEAAKADNKSAKKFIESRSLFAWKKGRVKNNLSVYEMKVLISLQRLLSEQTRGIDKLIEDSHTVKVAGSDERGRSGKVKKRIEEARERKEELQYLQEEAKKGNEILPQYATVLDNFGGYSLAFLSEESKRKMKELYDISEGDCIVLFSATDFLKRYIGTARESEEEYTKLYQTLDKLKNGFLSVAVEGKRGGYSYRTLRLIHNFNFIEDEGSGRTLVAVKFNAFIGRNVANNYMNLPANCTEYFAAISTEEGMMLFLRLCEELSENRRNEEGRRTEYPTAKADRKEDMTIKQPLRTVKDTATGEAAGSTDTERENNTGFIDTFVNAEKIAKRGANAVLNGYNETNSKGEAFRREGLLQYLCKFHELGLLTQPPLIEEGYITLKLRRL